MLKIDPTNYIFHLINCAVNAVIIFIYIDLRYFI